MHPKVRYVRSGRKTRFHECHWPGCSKQVPPVMWGCREHWFAIPSDLRARIWRAYRPGQEIDMKPSSEYVKVAVEVQNWIAKLTSSATPVLPDLVD